MAKAKSTDPVKVAAAMEGLKVDSFNGEVRNAQGRPPAAATAVRHGLAKGRQEYPVQSREHGHDPGAGQGVPELCVEYTYQLPDEAPILIQERLVVCAQGPSGCAVEGPLFDSVEEGWMTMEFFIISMLNGTQLWTAAVHVEFWD